MNSALLFFVVASSLPFVTSALARTEPAVERRGGESSVMRVIACNDGDTCRLATRTNETIKVRLVGIDAPETRGKGKKSGGQPLSLNAKSYLNSLVQGKEVTLERYGIDLYGRVLGEIFIDKQSANLQVVREGLAEVYRGKPPAGFNLEPYTEAELSAKREKKGIWGTATYESPKDFRKKR